MKLLKLKDVIAMTSLSKASVYRQMNAGTFPLPCIFRPIMNTNSDST
ncbi:AlpA family phage regulatory protein [Aeromonas hydrophila]|nr:AlpA family phage regulatory protein [Aeromonas hydrophila]